ncbi:hypothetical protein [Phenylobacterium sp.]|uniref:hypothetical protein n=1 Tax=Phenylobacterium sp. TaxID=1871053 RepID=UPI0035B09E75
MQRGQTGPLVFGDYAAAVRAAETLARAAASRGDKGAVRIVRPGERPPELRTFEPEFRGSHPRVGYHPELDWRNGGAARLS